MQFRSNLVARWEYKAGSELYLVWSKGNTPDTSEYMDQGLNENLFNNLLGQQANNIFLVKLTYRFFKKKVQSNYKSALQSPVFSGLLLLKYYTKILCAKYCLKHNQNIYSKFP
ncbi:MAG: hypothetical protein ACI9IP_002417 [Arcticibacterium sp.]|jgi:hypothetical protein